MERYAPSVKDLAPRDMVSRAMTIEIREGRGVGPKKDHIFLHLDHLDPKMLAERLPGISESAKIFAGVDVTKEPIPVLPTVHYNMGGIPTNFYSEVVTRDGDDPDKVVPGLMAVGEAACVSVHGANRLGGNSLSDLLVFGRRAGAAAAGKRGGAPAIPDGEIEQAMREALEPFEHDGENPFAVQSALQVVMQRNAGIIRDKAGLQTALAELEKLKGRARMVGVTGSREYNPGWHTAIDLQSLLVVSEATARAALERTESRGGHTRSDFPDSDDKQARELIVVKKEGNRMAVRRESQPPIPADLTALIKESV
jgi:succinate dehydrogenase / fumarate reductase flavoprotein subunit